MNKLNSPFVAAAYVRRGSVLFLLFFVLVLANAIEGYAQSSSVRPVARLVSTSRAVIPISSRAHVLSVPPLKNVNTGASMPAAATSLERRAFDLINVQRRAKGQSPLVWDADLCRMARRHSQTMASQGFFNHVGPDGLDTADRARMSGLYGWKMLGENIAYNQGYDDPAGFAVERWMISGKHRANILNPQFNRSAIGVAQSADGRVFLTQVFIAR